MSKLNAITLIIAAVEWNGIDRFNAKFVPGDEATLRPQASSNVTEVPSNNNS